MNRKTAAVLVCAGSGSRMKGACADKLMLELAGMPVAAHTLLAYDRAESIDLIVVVCKQELVENYRAFKERYGIKKDYLVTAGGATRMESVMNGVRFVPEGFEMVAIGDGARPLIRTEDIEKTIAQAKKVGAAALGVYVTDTVKEVADGKILRTVPRENLVSIQTPQVFQRAQYLEIAAKAVQSGQEFTDDASIYEWFGKEVAFVSGHRDNLKITAPEDIAIMKIMMEERQ